MKPKEITVNYGVTKNMGNYESLRLDYSIKLELGEEEPVGESLFKVQKELRHKVQAGIAEEIDFLENINVTTKRPPRR